MLKVQKQIYKIDGISMKEFVKEKMRPLNQQQVKMLKVQVKWKVLGSCWKLPKRNPQCQGNEYYMGSVKSK